MEARALTLFDDEDFLPQAEAPKKPVKKAAANANPAEQPATALPGEQEPPASTTPETVPPDAAAAKESETVQPPVTAAAQDVQAPATEQPGTAMPASLISIELPELQAPVAEQQPAPDTTPDEARAADEALDRQILSELVLSDYTALIHRDYPFDIAQASVVKKNKPVSPPQPEQAAEELTDAEEDEEEVFEDIVPLPEWNLDKKYYTIGEVAQLFAVNTSHIRFWTNEFKLKPRTTRKGDRLYNPKDIAELRLIHHLVKEKKHTIKGAREKLKVEKSGVNQKLDLKESLTGLRDMLVRIHEQL